MLECIRAEIGAQVACKEWSETAPAVDSPWVKGKVPKAVYEAASAHT